MEQHGSGNWDKPYRPPPVELPPFQYSTPPPFVGYPPVYPTPGNTFLQQPPPPIFSPYPPMYAAGNSVTPITQPHIHGYIGHYGASSQHQHQFMPPAAQFVQQHHIPNVHPPAYPNHLMYPPPVVNTFQSQHSSNNLPGNSSINQSVDQSLGERSQPSTSFNSSLKSRVSKPVTSSHTSKSRPFPRKSPEEISKGLQDAEKLSAKLEEYSNLTPEEIIENEKKTWTRCAPADLYYVRDKDNPNMMQGTEKLKATINEFQVKLIERGEKARARQPKIDNPPRKSHKQGNHHCGRNSCSERNDKAFESEDSESSDSSSEDEIDRVIQELEQKKKHPARLHTELWHNDVGEMNDGPLCRCSFKARRTGIRHGIYAGESSSRICQLNSNNADVLHHYRVTISPPTNFLLKRPTIIHHDEHEFIFEGFSLLSHYPLDEGVPTCKVIRFNIEYTIVYIKEKVPDNFTTQELELFNRYLFEELLELVDLNLHADGNKSEGCPQFHIMPRFVRDLPEHGKEMLSMNQVLMYLLRQNQPVIDDTELGYHLKIEQVIITTCKLQCGRFNLIFFFNLQHEWQNMADQIKGMIVTKPG